MGVVGPGVYRYGPQPGRVATLEFGGRPADRSAPVTLDEVRASLRRVPDTDVTLTAPRAAATRWTDNTRRAATYRSGWSPGPATPPASPPSPASMPPAPMDRRAGVLTRARTGGLSPPGPPAGHPLHLGEELAEWGDLFADHEILQPFPQLGRAVHRLTDDEAAGDRLARFENITVPTASLLGLERRGWERDEPMFAGVRCWLSKRVAKDRWGIVSPSVGFTIGAVDVSTEQSLEFVGLSEQPSAWDPPGEPSRLAFAELDPVAASELLADLTEPVTR